MKFSALLSLITLNLVLAGPARLERRKSFVETHQEHGHLPGGDNNPGVMALIPQLMGMLGGKGLGALTEYNQAADAKEGRAPEQSSGNGMLEALGGGDIPLLGKMV